MQSGKYSSVHRSSNLSSHVLLSEMSLKTLLNPLTRASAKQQVANEKQMTEKLNAHKLKLKACFFLYFSWPKDFPNIYILITRWLAACAQRRLQEARGSLSEAESQLRVERHTNEQLQAEITHRAQQFKQLQEEIVTIQRNMEESRQANQVCILSQVQIPIMMCLPSLAYLSISLRNHPISSSICIYFVFFQAQKARLRTQLDDAKKVENDLHAKLEEEHTLLETAQRLIDREQEVAAMLRKDIVTRDDDLATLQVQFEEQSKRNAEMASLLEQRQNALNGLQEKLDAKLEDEKQCSWFRSVFMWHWFSFVFAFICLLHALRQVLASLEAQKIKFQQFELDKKELEKKLLQSEVWLALSWFSHFQRIQSTHISQNHRH